MTIRDFAPYENCGKQWRMTDALRHYRIVRGLTGTALAELIGVSAATLCRWELGHRRPPLWRLATIHRVTGIAPAELRPDLAALLQE